MSEARRAAQSSSPPTPEKGIDSRCLANRQCEACRPGSPPVAESERASLLSELPTWLVDPVDGIDQLAAEYRFSDFAAALEFVQRVGALAEAENHHPKLVLEWGRVEVRWWTHSIGGLHMNDFIMAARSDRAFARHAV